MRIFQKEQVGISVLIIEDNPGDYLLIEDFLIEKYLKISINHCKNYESAIEFLKSENRVSVILLDLQLPDLTGLDLIREILSQNFHIPIIILTGYSDLDLAQKSLRLGVYDFLIKDEINPTLLHKSIEFAISRRSFIHQLKEEKFNYESLFNFSPQPMWLLDHQTLKILNANFSAIQNYGYSLNDLLKMSFVQLHPEEERKLVMEKLSSSQNVSNQHYTHKLKNGDKIKVDIYCGEVKIISNTNVIVVQSNNITESLEYINTIEIQNEKLKSIAWTQSHVVRAPLARILSIIHLIEGSKESSEDLFFWLSQLKASTNEMDVVVQKIVKQSQNFKL